MLLGFNEGTIDDQEEDQMDLKLQESEEEIKEEKATNSENKEDDLACLIISIAKRKGWSHANLSVWQSSSNFLVSA